MAEYSGQYKLRHVACFATITANSKVRINEGVTICVPSHIFSLKFLIENQFSTAEVETFDWLRSLFDIKLITGTLGATRRNYFLTSLLTGL